MGRQFLTLCLAVLGLQMSIGVLGFYFHGTSILGGPSGSLFDNVLYGAPMFAPLLFPNLALLAAIGVHDLRKKTSA